MSYYGSQYHTYGATPERIEEGELQAARTRKSHSWMPKTRSRTTPATLCTCLVLPWLLFALVYANVNFVQYDYAGLCDAIVICSFLPVLAIGAIAATKIKEFMSGNASAAWLIFLAVSSFVAVGLGYVVGNMNYSRNMYPYYNLQTLNTYKEIDPRTMNGQQVMDAGRVSFLPTATIDLWKAMSFQDYDEYCVAPITVKKNITSAIEPLKYYDFWVVGLNCCKANVTHPVDYRCGDYLNGKAHEGLRVMDAVQRKFFRLAAQQAEAKYKINARYPVFFHWVENAEAELSSYSSYGVSYFVKGLVAFFFMQLGLMLATSFAITLHGV